MLYGYVTFAEIHKLITEPSYYKEKIKILKDLFILSKFNQKQIYELNASLNFFENDFNNLDSRTKGILISESEYENLRKMYHEIYKATEPDNKNFNQNQAIKGGRKS